jgi:hypothetical protein
VVRDIVARLEHAPPSQLRQLRTDLGGGTEQFAPVAEFVNVSGELQPGQTAEFAFAFPLRSPTEPALGIDRPGVYPLLVNVNGTRTTASPPASTTAGSCCRSSARPRRRIPPPRPALPTPPARCAVTMLWPLADRPRLVPGVPGGTTPVRLATTRWPPNWRRRSAGQPARSRRLRHQPGRRPRRGGDPGLCLAVDPDLLVTVNAMTAGYVVADPGQTGATQPGTGQDAAAGWLNRLRPGGSDVRDGRPYAQASLDALQRVGDARLTEFATTGSADVVTRSSACPGARGHPARR